MERVFEGLVGGPRHDSGDGRHHSAVEQMLLVVIWKREGETGHFRSETDAAAREGYMRTVGFEKPREQEKRIVDDNRQCSLGSLGRQEGNQSLNARRRHQLRAVPFIRVK